MQCPAWHCQKHRVDIAKNMTGILRNLCAQESRSLERYVISKVSHFKLRSSFAVNPIHTKCFLLGQDFAILASFNGNGHNLYIFQFKVPYERLLTNLACSYCTYHLLTESEVITGISQTKALMY